MEFERHDIRKLIFYCWKQGLSSRDTAKEMCSVLGDNIVSERTCRTWMNRFSDGDFSIDEKMRSGRPSTYGLDDQICAILQNDRHACSREIAQMIGVSHDTVWRHLHSIGKQYLHNCWIPHQLTDKNKMDRVRICCDLLQSNAESYFLNQIITCDECWIYWENEGHGGHNRSWQGAGDSAVTVPKRTSMTKKKHLVTVFWDSKGLILLDTMPSHQTMTAEYYCSLLDILREEMKRKRRRMISDGFHRIHFLHDNARPHVANITKSKLQELNLTTLPHPPYLPDIAPSDYYLFSAMKSTLRGKNFENESDINKDLSAWFNSKPRDFFRKAFDILPKRWQKIVSTNGDYIV